MISPKMLAKLAQTHQTPLFVYDFDGITARVGEFRAAFRAKKSLLCYALKANANLSLLRHLAALECGADCVSINEVKKAMLAGVAPYKIIYSGVGKGASDIREALERDILFINVESIEELLLVEKIAANLGRTARVSVRVNPNVNPKTHPHISTGLKENKFGVGVEVAKKMYLHAQNSRHLSPVAVHFHIGSQLLDLAPIIEAAEKIVELIFGLLALKIDIKFLDVGGGIGIRYTNEVPISLYDYAQGILGAMRGLDLTIICEPGRYIVGNEGVLLSRVLYEKQDSHKRFCIIDAAMTDLVRPALYDATHEVELISEDLGANLSLNLGGESANLGGESPEIPSIFKDLHESLELCDIVGPVCESSDFIAKNVRLPRTKSGDLIAIKSAGAYGFSMASNYNLRTRGAEVAVLGGKAFLIRKKENFEDLIALESGDGVGVTRESWGESFCESSGESSLESGRESGGKSCESSRESRKSTTPNGGAKCKKS